MANYGTISVFPRESPRITGHERAYGMQDQLDVNCSSAKSFPAPDLQWVIDGQKVSTYLFVRYDLISRVPNAFLTPNIFYNVGFLKFSHKHPQVFFLKNKPIK